MGFEKRSRPFARAYRNTPQTFADIIGAVVQFDSQQYDTDDMFTPTDSKIYAKRLSGYYLVEGSVGFESADAGWRMGYLRVNGSTYIAEAHAINEADAGCVITLHCPWYFNVNDYVELYCGQHSGGNLNTFIGEFVTWMSLMHISGR